MTRVNVGILPAELPDRVLLAEHREIKRLPNLLARVGWNWKQPMPTQFTLGTGHMKFLMTKGYYTLMRYKSLHHECKRRGFNVVNYSSAWQVYNRYISLYNEYEEQPEDRELLLQRFAEKGFTLKELV